MYPTLPMHPRKQEVHPTSQPVHPTCEIVLKWPTFSICKSSLRRKAGAVFASEEG